MIVLIVRHTPWQFDRPIVHLTTVITRSPCARLITVKMVVIVLIVRRIIEEGGDRPTVHASPREVIVAYNRPQRPYNNRRRLFERGDLILADLGRVIVLSTGNRPWKWWPSTSPPIFQEVLHTDVRKGGNEHLFVVRPIMIPMLSIAIKTNWIQRSVCWSCNEPIRLNSFLPTQGFARRSRWVHHSRCCSVNGEVVTELGTKSKTQRSREISRRTG